MYSNTLQEQAYQAIRKKIIYCEFEPRRKISENDLTDMLNIGRTPVREALIQLRQQQLVYTVPQSGTYVSLIDLQSAQNARFVREQLERQIMMECCAKLTVRTQKVLDTILEQQLKAIDEEDKTAFFQTDNLFHQACFEIAGRLEVWHWLNTHNTHLERFRWLRLTTENLKWTPIIEEHHALYQAIIDRNPEEANYLAAVHLHMMAKDLEPVTTVYPDYFVAQAEDNSL